MTTPKLKKNWKPSKNNLPTCLKAAYVTRGVFFDDLNPSESTTIKFKKPFSKIPFVKVTFDLKTNSAQAIYITNVTKTGFDIAAKNANDLGQLYGVWYEAHLID